MQFVLVVGPSTAEKKTEANSNLSTNSAVAVISPN